jgi:hypothetical protein
MSILRNGDVEENFTATFYMMDVNRIRYLLTKYLRVRIFKIEKMSHFALNDNLIFNRLSKNEKWFLTNLAKLNEMHMNESIYENIPLNEEDKSDIVKLLKNEDQDMLLRHMSPDLSKFVFCRSVEDINDIYIWTDSDGTVLNGYLKKGEIYIYQYSLIQSYVMQGKVELL